MRVKEFCNIFCIKYSNGLSKNKKFNELIKYINKNHIEYLYTGEEIMTLEKFLTFLDEINSVSLAAEILKDYKDLTAIGISPKMVAKYYNIYPKDYFYYPGSYVADILTDKKYLDEATIEWTKEHIFDAEYNKALVIKGDGISVKKNKSKEISNMHQNINALHIAREKGILKQAIESLSK